MEGFDQVPLQFPSCFATMHEARRPLTFPAREKQGWNHFQRLCGLLGFCSGAVATDGGLTKSKQHCTEKENGKALAFRIGHVQQTSTEPLWGRQDIQGRQKGERDVRRTLKDIWFEECRFWVCFQSHTVEISHDRESFMQAAREQAQQTPGFAFSSPRRRQVAKCTITVRYLFLAHSKHSGVETIWHTVIQLTVYTLVSGPLSYVSLDHAEWKRN